MKAYTGHGVRLIYDVVSETRPIFGESLPEAPQVTTAADAMHYLQSCGLIPQEREAVLVLYLDARHKTIAAHVVSVGGLSSAPMHPREIFRPAIALGAAAIILAHNHPSGDEKPSAEDHKVTDRLTEAGKLVGIPVLDHLVVGHARFHSIAGGTSHAVPRRSPGLKAAPMVGEHDTQGGL